MGCNYIKQNILQSLLRFDINATILIQNFSSETVCLHRKAFLIHEKNRKAVP